MRVRPFLAARTIRKADAPCPPVRTDTPVPETGVVDRHRRTAIGNSRLTLGANKGPVALETANAEELLHRFPKRTSNKTLFLDVESNYRWNSLFGVRGGGLG